MYNVYFVKLAEILCLYKYNEQIVIGGYRSGDI